MIPSNIKAILFGFACLLLSLCCAALPLNTLSGILAIGGRWVGFIAILAGIFIPDK